MIQLLTSIDYMDSRRVPISPTFKRVLVEVASNRRIDMAIVTAQQAKEFQDADDDYEDWSFEWVEGLQSNDFYVDAVTAPISLLVWNSNDDRSAVVAYKITDLTASANSSPAIAISKS